MSVIVREAQKKVTYSDGVMTAEASSLQLRGFPEVLVLEGRTRQETFSLAGVVRDAEGDVTHADYRPLDPKLPTLRIWND